MSDPRDRQRILRTVVVRDAHLATSGRYEQGDHILDPRTGRAATTVDSATVLCADGGTADALASALMVQGPAGLVGLDALGAVRVGGFRRDDLGLGRVGSLEGRPSAKAAGRFPATIGGRNRRGSFAVPRRGGGSRPASSQIRGLAPLMGEAPAHAPGLMP